MMKRFLFSVAMSFLITPYIPLFDNIAYTDAVVRGWMVFVGLSATSMYFADVIFDYLVSLFNK